MAATVVKTLAVTPQLSRNLREGLKTGIAVSASLGIAYSMGWSEPVWAGLSALAVHMGQPGASALKGLNRIAGTLLAAATALLLLSLFSQNRWGFMLAMSAWLLFGTYMSLASKRDYLWMKATVIPLLLVIHSGLDSLTSFTVVMSRSQATVLGVIVNSLVEVFLWPEKTRPVMLQAILGAVRLQHEVIRDFFTGEYAQRDREAISERPRLFIKSVTRFSSLLDQCMLEDLRAVEERHALRRVMDIAKRMIRIQGRIKHAITSYGGENPLLTAFSGAPAYLSEMNARAAHMEDLFAKGEVSARDRREIVRVRLFPREEAMTPADEEERRLVAILDDCLRELEEAHAEACALLEDIFCRDARLPASSPPRAPRGLDPEAARLALCMAAFFCVFFLLNIYTRVPVGAGSMYLTALFMLQGVLAPRRQPQDLLPAFFVGAVLASFLFFLVLPNITEFYQLAFCITGAFCLSWTVIMKPLGKWPCILMVIYCEPCFSSPPVYDVMNVFNLSVVFCLFFLISYALTESIASLRPERRFDRLDGWFYASAAARTDRMFARPSPRGVLERLLRPRLTPPWELASRMDDAAAQYKPRRISARTRRILSGYVNLTHLLAFHLAALDEDRQRLAGHPILQDFQRDADAGLEKLRRVLVSFTRESLDQIVPETGEILLDLRRAVERVASALQGQGAPTDAEKTSWDAPAWRDAFRFTRSLELVADNLIQAKSLRAGLGAWIAGDAPLQDWPEADHIPFSP